MTTDKFNISDILTNLRSSDPDNRYMALSDFIKNIEKGQLTTKNYTMASHLEHNLYTQLYELMNYFHGNIQNLTVQLLKKLIANGLFSNPENIMILTEKLCFTLNNREFCHHKNSKHGNKSSYHKPSELTEDNLDGNLNATKESLIEICSIALHGITSGLLQQYSIFDESHSSTSKKNKHQNDHMTSIFIESSQNRDSKNIFLFITREVLKSLQDNFQNQSFIVNSELLDILTAILSFNNQGVYQQYIGKSYLQVKDVLIEVLSKSDKTAICNSCTKILTGQFLSNCNQSIYIDVLKFPVDLLQQATSPGIKEIAAFNLITAIINEDPEKRDQFVDDQKVDILFSLCRKFIEILIEADYDDLIEKNSQIIQTAVSALLSIKSLCKTYPGHSNDINYCQNNLKKWLSYDPSCFDEDIDNTMIDENPESESQNDLSDNESYSDLSEYEDFSDVEDTEEDSSWLIRSTACQLATEVLKIQSRKENDNSSDVSTDLILVILNRMGKEQNENVLTSLIFALNDHFTNVDDKISDYNQQINYRLYRLLSKSNQKLPIICEVYNCLKLFYKCNKLPLTWDLMETTRTVSSANFVTNKNNQEYASQLLITIGDFLSQLVTDDNLQRFNKETLDIALEIVFKYLLQNSNHRVVISGYSTMIEIFKTVNRTSDYYSGCHQYLINPNSINCNLINLISIQLNQQNTDKEIKNLIIQFINLIAHEFRLEPNSLVNCLNVVIPLLLKSDTFKNEFLKVSAKITGNLATLAKNNSISSDNAQELFPCLDLSKISPFLRNREIFIVQNTIKLLTNCIEYDRHIKKTSGNSSLGNDQSITAVCSELIPNIFTIMNNEGTLELKSNLKLVIQSVAFLKLIFTNFAITSNKNASYLLTQSFIIIMKTLSQANKDGYDLLPTGSMNSWHVHSLYKTIVGLRKISCINNIDFESNFHQATFSQVIAIDYGLVVMMPFFQNNIVFSCKIRNIQ